MKKKIPVVEKQRGKKTNRNCKNYIIDIINIKTGISLTFPHLSVFLIILLNLFQLVAALKICYLKSSADL